MNNDQHLLELLGSDSETQFKPYIEESKGADALNFYFRPDADYSKRLTDHVTVFLSLDTNELVGCRIKGVSELLADLPNYIGIDHNGTKLSILFWSFRGGVDDEVRRTLNELAKAAGDMQYEPAC